MGSLRAAYNLDALQKRYGLHFFCARTSIAWQCCTAPILGPSVNEHHITNSLIFYFDTARVHLMYFFFFFFLQKYNTCPQYFWGNGCTMEWGPCFSDYLCAQNPRQLNGLANIKNQTDTPNICKFPPFRPPSCIRISNIYSSTSGTKPIQIYWAVFQHPTFLSKQGSNPAAYLSTGPSAISPHKPFHMHIVCVYIDNMDFGGYARTFRICHFNIFDTCPYSKNPNNNNNKKNFAETQSPCSRGGKSRSPALVIAYLMASLRWSFKKSHTHMMERRPAIEVGLCTQCNFFVLLSLFLFLFCVVLFFGKLSSTLLIDCPFTIIQLD